MPEYTIEREEELVFNIGKEKPFSIKDAFQAHNEWVAIDKAHRNGTGAELPHYIELVKSWGGHENLTSREAVAVLKRIAEAVEEKKDESAQQPSSVGNTASTPSL